MKNDKVTLLKTGFRCDTAQAVEAWVFEKQHSAISD
jgi:hypothetical protein